MKSPVSESTGASNGDLPCLSVSMTDYFIWLDAVGMMEKSVREGLRKVSGEFSSATISEHPMHIDSHTYILHALLWIAPTQD